MYPHFYLSLNSSILSFNHHLSFFSIRIHSHVYSILSIHPSIHFFIYSALRQPPIFCAQVPINRIAILHSNSSNHSSTYSSIHSSIYPFNLHLPTHSLSNFSSTHPSSTQFFMILLLHQSMYQSTHQSMHQLSGQPDKRAGQPQQGESSFLPHPHQRGPRQTEF